MRGRSKLEADWGAIHRLTGEYTRLDAGSAALERGVLSMTLADEWPLPAGSLHPRILASPRAFSGPPHRHHLPRLTVSDPRFSPIGYRGQAVFHPGYTRLVPVD